MRHRTDGTQYVTHEKYEKKKPFVWSAGPNVAASGTLKLPL